MFELFIDTETTGLKAFSNGIWQISFIIYKDGEVVSKYKGNISLFSCDKIDQKALEVGGVTEEQIKRYITPTLAYTDIKNTFELYIDKYNPKDKFTMYAYNARFDYDFLRAWWSKNGDKYFGSYVHFPPIDVMNLAAYKLRGERNKLKDFKLHTVAAYLGIEIDKEKLHDAMYDIEIIREIYLKVTNI